jgi:predicted transcriptional regulator YdeE
METKIVERGRLALAGLCFFGDPFKSSAGWTEENEIGRVWKRFMAYCEQHPGRLQPACPGVFYELHVYHEESKRIGEFEVFVGMPVDLPRDMPVELSLKILPPAAYAVFTLEGQQIVSDWPKLIDAWMAEAGYQLAHPFHFQYYDERFKGLDRVAESQLDVYVPVVK